jgi:DNA replication and repair protein RecF
VSTASLADVRGFYLEQWHKLRRREMELGYTSLGPHKDDLLIAIGGHDVRDFASEGQQRSCASALRFAQWQRLCRLSAEAPLMLLDDVGISLDESRRRKLLQHVVALGQVFLTSTQPLSHSFEGAEKQIIRMENGRTHQF